MYEELLSEIKETQEDCAENAENNFISCAYVSELLQKAADAIEELSKRIDWWKEMFFSESSSARKWISVEEALPEPPKEETHGT